MSRKGIEKRRIQLSIPKGERIGQAIYNVLRNPDRLFYITDEELRKLLRYNVREED